MERFCANLLCAELMGGTQSRYNLSVFLKARDFTNYFYGLQQSKCRAASAAEELTDSQLAELCSSGEEKSRKLGRGYFCLSCPALNVYTVMYYLLIICTLIETGLN